MWAGIAKWVVTSILLPLAQQLISAWLKSRERASKLKEKFKANQAKTEAYEKDPSSDDSFSQLP